MARTSRAAFLARVSEAADRMPGPELEPPPPPSPSLPANLLAERFKLELEAVHGRAHLVASSEEGRAALRTILEGASSYVRSPHSVLDELGLEAVASELGLSPADPSEAAVGVTGCEFAVAATGSVALSSSWGRLAALLPPHHVVVLRASQLVPDIQDAYLELGRRELPGAWGFHTGPSKSADIEQTMALGVHGPGRVDVIVLLEPPLEGERGD